MMSRVYGGVIKVDIFFHAETLVLLILSLRRWINIRDNQEVIIQMFVWIIC